MILALARRDKRYSALLLDQGLRGNRTRRHDVVLRVPTTLRVTADGDTNDKNASQNHQQIWFLFHVPNPYPC